MAPVTMIPLPCTLSGKGESLAAMQQCTILTLRKYVDEEMKRLKLHFAMLSETTGKDGRQAASAGWKSEKALNRKKRLHGQPGSATEDQTNDEQSQLSAAEGTQ